MNSLTVKNIYSLEKVMPFKKFSATAFNKASCLLDEEFSYQIIFKANDFADEELELHLEVESDIADCIEIYNVKNVPVYLTNFNGYFDDCYISHSGGLYPDILEPYTDHVLASKDYYKTLWVSVKPNCEAMVGLHKIKVKFLLGNDVLGESVFSLEVIDVKMPCFDLPVTNWFHCDCIADFYNVKALSKKHWEYIDSFMAEYVKHGFNMILTPIFTPALDTKVVYERTTVQLVEISYDNGKYSFDFVKLSKWIELCKKHGIKYLEMPHLYTQWGAEHAPKIVVKENGKNLKKFGWKTDAESYEYKEFLSQFLPELISFLKQSWEKDNIYFHISDEPRLKHIEHYGNLYKFVKPMLKDVNLMDALSNIELYSRGFVDVPVVSTPHANEFIESGHNNFWAYYCCSHGGDNYSNRFIAMPSFRNRITGLQTYVLDVKGFLHWGFNFYYARLSTHKINPYISTDADGRFPAGDSFVVYPADNGANPSLRLKVFRDGFQDRMALKLLEDKIGKDEVLKLVTNECEIDFNHYPHSAEYILALREKVNKMLKELK